MTILLLILLLASACAPRAAVVPAASPPGATGSGARETAYLVADAATAGRPTADVLLETTTTVAGEAIRYPSSPLPQIVAEIVTIKPGQSTGWHRHGVPMFGYILSGTVDVEYDGLGHRRLGPGDRLMEAMAVAHNGANLGTEDVRILVVLMGARGTTPVMKAEPPAMPADLGGSRRAELVDLEDVDPRIRLDLRYASADNFTGRVVYSNAPRAFLQKPAAEALRRANE
ncbi:MAG: cupin domain-containing protein, partial [Candidatus Binatia bacterium]